jgi:acyl-CoA-binding protein
MSMSPSSTSNGSTLLAGMAALTATAVAVAGTAWYLHRRQTSATVSSADENGKDGRKYPSLPPSSIQETGGENNNNNQQESLIEQRFQMCVVQMKSQLPKLAHSQQLTYYGLYKQATIGDCDEYQPHPPSALDIVATKKYQAWQSRKGMPRVAAMQEYIDKVVTFEFTKEMMDLGGGGGNDDDDLQGEAIMDVQGMGNHVSTLVDDNNDDDDLIESKTHPVHVAARKGLVGELKRLLEDNMTTRTTTITNVNQTDDAGQSPLHLAADQGRVDCVKILILNGADIHATDNDGISVLQAAVIGGSIDVTRLLLALGSDPDQQDHDGDTPRSEAENEGPKMKQIFEEYDERKFSGGSSVVLDEDFVKQLEQNGVAFPQFKGNGANITASERTTSNKRPNVEEELKNLSTIHIELDDDGDM